MPARCLLCGAVGATCGTPTTTLPVDARITGVKVAGDKLVPDVMASMPEDVTDEERAEYELMAIALSKRSLRNQILSGSSVMADGKAGHTSLVYVDRGDGIQIKMRPDVAEKYVEMNKAAGASIVREGALPLPPENEVIGATKASVGEMFDGSGRQIEGEQLMTTSRTFHASDRINWEAVHPAAGTTGAASTEVNTGTGSQTSSSVTHANAGSTGVPRVVRPGTAAARAAAASETNTGAGAGESAGGSTGSTGSDAE